MTCNDIRSRLTALLDHELPEEEAGSLRQHLDQCAACAGIMADYSALRAAVTAAPQSAPDDIWDAISAQIGAEIDTQAILSELRRMREELILLRGEVTDLRRELAKRPLEAPTRRLPLSLPGVPSASQRPYRLV